MAAINVLSYLTSEISRRSGLLSSLQWPNALPSASASRTTPPPTAGGSSRHPVARLCTTTSKSSPLLRNAVTANSNCPACVQIELPMLDLRLDPLIPLLHAILDPCASSSRVCHHLQAPKDCPTGIRWESMRCLRPGAVRFCPHLSQLPYDIDILPSSSCFL